MFTMSIDSTQPYLAVTASGTAGLTELSDLAARIAELARGARDRVLADLSGVEASMSFADHLEFDSLAWELLGGIERVAVVVPAAWLGTDAARAARMTGSPLKTFVEAREAAAWVAGRSPRRIPVRRTRAAAGGLGDGARCRHEPAPARP